MKTKNNYYVPIVLEGREGNERASDIWSKLLQERIVFLGTDIDNHVANLIVAQLLFLQSQDPEKEIKFYINSGGGLCTAGFAIYDTMQTISNPISTICLGQACSMAAILLTAGTKGKRKSLPNSRVMLHQISSGFGGKATDIMIEAKEIARMKKQLTEIVAHHTGKEYEQVLQDMERDFFMSSKEALNYGLIDKIIKK